MSTATVSDRVFNFSAGPATLPLKVLQEAQENLLCLPGVGASILEISHRSPPFEAIIGSAEADMRKLLNISDDYAVLFLQGGATTQFSMVPLNFLNKEKSADYILQGAWSKKAIGEAKKCGNVNVVWDGSSEKFSRVPTQEEIKPTSGAAYLHMTSNETIEGIEFHYDPNTGNVPLVCDASSDFMHRPLDMKNFSLIYAGAQKNVGPAGSCVVIIRKDLLEQQVAGPHHTMLDYKKMVAGGSMHNTPPVFTIYILSLVMKWLVNDIGGLDKMHELNQKKANLLYDYMDASGGYYKPHAQKGSRSLMNVTWRMRDEDLEKKFIKEAKAARLDGLKGHRDVGGLRASLYNAFPYEGVEALVGFMKEFVKNNG
ncbi:MAG: 3-phosphoserine/phosphohydroxythreonine transaminase [Candidatus Eremiobacteraeota bacterium]|nr:3-phosphoserine/phosphohydroxythreonine transaminase [Candidatus Eremiobacteraeota bacterium]